MTDKISLTIPSASPYRAVVTLVLGGIGSRLDLPYERMDDLQLAVLSVLDAGAAETVTLEIEAEPSGLTVFVGPLTNGSGSDSALTRVLDRLVDSTESARRDGREWLTLRLTR
jgi:hypothetical protein